VAPSSAPTSPSISAISGSPIATFPGAALKAMAWNGATAPMKTSSIAERSSAIPVSSPSSFADGSMSTTIGARTWPFVEAPRPSGSASSASPATAFNN
jgi:hypothetical protein